MILICLIKNNSREFQPEKQSKFKNTRAEIEQGQELANRCVPELPNAHSCPNLRLSLARSFAPPFANLLTRAC